MKNKVEIIIEGGQNYALSVKGGATYTSVGYSASSYGGVSPCDTEEDVQRAIGHAKECIKEAGDIPVVVDKRQERTLTSFF